VFDDVDLLIAGAGPVGCVIAAQAARTLGWRVLIVEKRRHIAGNCYDRYHESGVFVHEYGPHYFRTNNKGLIDYLSQYTEWIPGNYIVKSATRGKLFPFPINLDTLSQFYDKELTAEDARALLDSVRSPIDNPSNSEEFVLSRVGRELYEAFYLGYTLKQWDRHPRELDASVCGRIPVRFNHDSRYVDQQYQLMPADGYTTLFTRMIDHPGIHVMLDTDYKDVAGAIAPSRATVYTGPIDHYFDYCFGPLPWRSLTFDWKTYDQEYVQPCVQINYPNDHAYTRSVEIKHVTRQIHPKTVVTYEYPCASGDPYYPVPARENTALYTRYKELADAERRERRVYFLGRLANYVYMNTDEAIERALQTFEVIRQDCFRPR
jgi:UDP-galactopyranose mutase